MCEHNKQRCKCKNCGGSQICSHDKYKRSCKECRLALPLEVSLSRYKNACVVCGYILATNEQKIQRLCCDHIKEKLTERVETRWNKIINRFFDFPSSTSNDAVYVNCADKKYYYPDLTYQTDKLAIVLELDEKSHSSYDSECEIKRAVNMKDGFPNQKLLIIRMNPDSCKEAPEELQSLESRTCLMIEIMRQYIDLVTNNNDELSDKVSNVIYMFYSNTGLRHIELAEENPDKINIIDKYYC